MKELLRSESLVYVRQNHGDSETPKCVYAKITVALIDMCAELYELDENAKKVKKNWLITRYMKSLFCPFVFTILIHFKNEKHKMDRVKI
jgi:hypothetical protein